MEKISVGAVRETPNLEQRVERLEKEAGHWRRMAMRLYGVSVALGAGLVFILALAAVKPAAVPDVIRAKKLEIVDDKGNTRAELAVDHDGTALMFYDLNGNALAQLEGYTDRSSLILSDEKDHGGAMLGSYEDGPNLVLFDGNGKSRATLEVVTDGPPLGPGLKFHDRADLHFIDEKGKVIWQAPPK